MSPRLRQLQQERGAFLHTITHDLRTPLTVIMGHAELLQVAMADANLGGMPRVSIDAMLLAGADGENDGRSPHRAGL